MRRVLIVGAGVAGQSLKEDLLNHPDYEVVGFLDDKAKAALGKLEDVNAVIREHKIDEVFFAIPSAPSKVVRDFFNSIEAEKVKFSIIPRSTKIISNEIVNLYDLKDVDILNLIGREPVKHDLLQAKESLSGKIVLITGAAGSIGSELVKQVLLMNPKFLVCVDWWENGIFHLQHELDDLDNIAFHIANIQNKTRLSQIFKKYNPDIVFHAAAYKHVPLMEDHPVEAFNNNTIGSLNLMELCIENKVKNFVYVSTDKAVNPVNVMGSTKRLGEMLLEVLADQQKTTKLSAVRFGNVIESNGSVVPIFKRQIEKGGPVTVTHKDITRFFMTKEEAAQLIIQSSTLGDSGEIFVLDMGEQIKIIDLAKSLIKLSGKHADIIYTGLRPGEKMYEELSYNPDQVVKTKHPKVFINKKENNFDYKNFFNTILELRDKTTKFSMTDDELRAALINMGFNLKKA